MARRSHFFRRGAIYYWRRRVPRTLEGALAIRQWCVSLRTPIPSLARRRAARMTAATDRLIEEIERRMSSPESKPTAAQLQQAFKDLFAQLLQEFDDFRLPPEAMMARSWEERLYYAGEGTDDPYELHNTWAGELELNNIDKGVAELLPKLAELGVRTPENRTQQRALARHAMEVASAAGLLFAQQECREPRRPMQEIYADLGLEGDLPARLLGCVRAEAAGEQAPAPVPDGLVPAGWLHPVAPTKKQREQLERRFSDVGQEYMESKLPGSANAYGRPDGPRHRTSWSDRKTPDDQRRAQRLFIELVGDLPMERIEPAHAIEFKKKLARMPVDYGARPYVGRAYNECIELADKLDRQNARAVRERIERDEIAPEMKAVERERAKTTRLSPKTQNKHLDACHKVFKYFKDVNRLPLDDPFQKVRYSRSALGRQAHEERDMWEDHELVALFRTPCWTGCHGRQYRHRPGPHVYKDAKYWIPLLCAHHGLRLEEAAQMWLEDVIQVGEHAALLVRKAEDRDIKAPSSARVIPLHPLIEQLGFLAYAEQLRRDKRTRLFPELEKDKWHDSYGMRISKWFRRYRQFLGTYQAKKDLHSMRHSFDTHLGEKNVNHITLSDLMGHTRQRESNESSLRYRKPAAFDKLRRVIERLDYGIPLVERNGQWHMAPANEDALCRRGTTRPQDKR